VCRALTALFGGAVGKDAVNRVRRKVKADGDAWNARALADEAIVRLIRPFHGWDIPAGRSAIAEVCLSLWRRGNRCERGARCGQ
jgi:hypothetical protein